MSEARKRIVGIDLGIDPDYLEEVVRQTVSAGIAEALGGKDAVASEIIHSVLDMRVDERGNPVKKGDWGYKGGTPIVEYFAVDIIRKEAASLVAEIVEQKRPQIREAIAKQLGSKAMIGELAEKFVAALVGSATNDWRCKIDVAFSEKNRGEY